VTAKYTNEIRYDFDLHQVRLYFFDRAMQFDGPTATPTHAELEQVAELVMTRQTFRAYLQILTDMASRLQPIGIPDPADREPEPAPEPDPFHRDPVMGRDY